MRACVMAAALVMASGGVASGQVLGLPVVNSGVPLGVAFGADVGFANELAGNGTAYGVRGELGIGLLGVSASISRSKRECCDAIISPGVAATLRLFGGPLIPFRAMLQVGASHWEVNEQVIQPGGGVVSIPFKTTHVPVSLGLAATIPVPAFAIKPWIAPRLDVTRTSFDGANGTTIRFGISGGIEVSMLNGFSLRAAYDRIIDGDSTPAILSVGIGFAP